MASEQNDRLRAALAPHHRSRLWMSLQHTFRFATTLLFDLKVYGKHHLPRTGGVLLVANHQSVLDPILLAVQLNRPMSFFAKAELFENRYFGWLIRRLGAFPIRRGQADVGAVRETLRRLNEGHLLTIYPEGTRSRDGEIGRIQVGTGMIIRRANVPVIPAVVDGSYRAWPRGRKLFRPCPARVLYGPPLRLAGLKSEQIALLIERTLKAMLEELRQTQLKDEKSKHTR